MSASPRSRPRLIALALATGLAAGLGGTLASPAAAAPFAPSPLSASPLASLRSAPAPAPTDEAGKAPLKDAVKGDKLGQHDRDLLAKAQARRQRTVTALFVTQRGKAAAVEAQIERLGGKVAYRNAKLGYVRGTVPSGRVTAAARLADVVSVDLNESIKRPDPGPAGATVTADEQAATYPGPSRTTPDANPYMPTNETGAVAFKRAYPRYDGRGVTIGIMDSGVDLNHPSLRTTSTGARKIVDWVTATDPVVDGDETWRPMTRTATGGTATFPADDRGPAATYRLPAGSFKVSRFDEVITSPSEPAGDVNRDGDRTDRFGVLYRASDNAVWVDANDNKDFRDDTLMRPYNVAYQVGQFGTNRAATPVDDRMPFVVEVRKGVDTGDGVVDFVNIGIVEDAHGSHVAGITAANNLFGGQMDGAAPGATLVSSRACTWGGGCTAVALTEGMIDLVVNRNVDVVNMSIGGLPALNDGNNARADLYDRLISDFGVQMFISAGNSGPGVNTVGDPSVANLVVSVGAAVSKATWKANYGSDVSAAQNMFNFSSRGPREDGGFKPDITAPGSAISTIPLWQAGSPVPEAGYSLPPGYAMFNGTSMSSPQAAGGAALLLSAGQATRTPITPAQLRQAVRSSAAYNPGVSAVAQGMGQMRVPQAWSLLRANQLRPRNYSVGAPVCTPISGFLKYPNSGRGLYNRCSPSAGGHAPGQSKTYTVRIRRTNGPADARVHTMSWLGNDGTFSAPRSVTLTRNVTTSFRVTAKPGGGLRSAVLRLDDASSPGLDFQIMTAVVAPGTLVAPNYARGTYSSVERNRTRSYFVDVPAGAKALQVNLSQIATGSQTRFIAFNPYGVPVESTSSLECYTNFSDRSVCNPNSRAYLDPIPGVWEVEVESRRTSPFLANPFSIRLAAQGVTVTPAEVQIASARAGQAVPVQWTVRNDFAPVTVRARGGALGSSRTLRPTIADGAQQAYTLTVPAGASRLDASIGNTSDLGADLDLYVLRGGAIVGADADGDSEESVSIADPPAGTYTVVVDGFDVPAGTTAYDYRDVFFSTALGSLAVPSTPVTLANRASTTIRGTVTARSAPAAGRQLLGEMQVVSTEGAVLGRGRVIVRAVTP